MRWPLPPPKGQICDASTGSGYDRLGKPVIYRCRQIAVETVKQTRPWGPDYELWLCAEHRDHFVAKGEVYRNPKKFPGKVT